MFLFVVGCRVRRREFRRRRPGHVPPQAQPGDQDSHGEQGDAEYEKDARQPGVRAVVTVRGMQFRWRGEHRVLPRVGRAEGPVVGFVALAGRTEPVQDQDEQRDDQRCGQ
ncbi:hypothetical protein ACGFYV_34690 [Streptomyces sp. NPDC048297]|uniref:hypothetical protein n=1 Tax=Streptomyces sp. NPDC048297 TaxID=3365531 RepID=UPI003720857B